MTTKRTLKYSRQNQNNPETGISIGRSLGESFGKIDKAKNCKTKRLRFGQKDGFSWIICEQRQFKVKNKEIIRIIFREIEEGGVKCIGENDGERKGKIGQKCYLTEWFM